MTFKRILLWAIPLSFWYSENAFFGWNWHAQSGIEVLCDGLFLLMVMIALLGERRGYV